MQVMQLSLVASCQDTHLSRDCRICRYLVTASSSAITRRDRSSRKKDAPISFMSAISSGSRTGEPRKASCAIGTQTCQIMVGSTIQQRAGRAQENVNAIGGSEQMRFKTTSTYNLPWRRFLLLRQFHQSRHCRDASGRSKREKECRANNLPTEVSNANLNASHVSVWRM